MLRVEHEKWGQTVGDLLRLAVESKHGRTRERFLALYEIAEGQSATEWSARAERHDDTVREWVHAYNNGGPEAVTYRHTGGWRPILEGIAQGIGGVLRAALTRAATPPTVARQEAAVVVEAADAAPGAATHAVAAVGAGAVPVADAAAVPVADAAAVPVADAAAAPVADAAAAPVAGAAATPVPDAAAAPVADSALAPVPRWTLKRLVIWVEETFQIKSCRETIRAALHHLGFSWKKGKKLLARANPAERQSFLERIKAVLEDVKDGKILLVYIDEAHIHLDADLGYLWTVRGERAWVSSTSPGLAKVSFYGIYFYNQGRVRILPHTCGNGENTIDVLKWLHEESPDQPMLIVWDGASYHRAGIVKEKAKSLGITLEPLPAYSPDFMPVEALWRWLREDVTYSHCHATCEELIQRVAEFEQRINKDSKVLADRLRVKDELNPEEEALRLAQWTLAQQQKPATTEKAGPKRAGSKRAAESAALARAITAWKGSPPAVAEPHATVAPQAA